MPFFLGEKAGTVGYEQAQIASASHIHSRKINLVQDSVAKGEPHAAAAVERHANHGVDSDALQLVDFFLRRDASGSDELPGGGLAQFPHRIKWKSSHQALGVDVGV